MLSWPLELMVPKENVVFRAGDLWEQEVILLGIHWVQAERGHQAHGQCGAVRGS